MRILYVEDNPANVFLVKRVAKMGNHEIINYIDGGEALKKFPEIFPDLILMDVQLSGELNGLDVVRRLRADGVKTPIIAVTAYAMVGDKERCIDAGCDDYLAKPLPIPRLLEIFDIYDPSKQAAKAPEPAPKAADDDMPVIITEVPNSASAATTAETSSPSTSSPVSSAPASATNTLEASPKTADSATAEASPKTADSTTVEASPKTADSATAEASPKTHETSNNSHATVSQEVKSEESGAAKTESSEKPEIKPSN